MNYSDYLLKDILIEAAQNSRKNADPQKLQEDLAYARENIKTVHHACPYCKELFCSVGQFDMSIEEIIDFEKRQLELALLIEKKKRELANRKSILHRLFGRKLIIKWEKSYD